MVKANLRETARKFIEGEIQPREYPGEDKIKQATKELAEAAGIKLEQEKTYEEQFGDICIESKVSVDSKGYEKVKALDDDNLFKPLIIEVKDFISSNKKDGVLHLKSKGINIYIEKEGYVPTELVSQKEKVLQHLALKEPREASEIIVKYIENNYHIYTTKDDLKSEMWIYKEGIYIPHGKSEIKEIVRRLLEEVFTTHFLNEVISKIEADTFIEPETFFKNIYIDEVPVLNGILNTKTRTLSPFDAKKIFFNKLPISYDKDATCPMIEEHFKTVLKSEDDVPVMFELFGYLLHKEYKIEQAFMFVGNGRNGKSKTLDLKRKFLGVENCASISLSAMNHESFDIWDLFGKMVNLAGDLSKTDLKDTGMFKQLVGRDLITARRKFLSSVKFNNYAKLVFACNELPRVYDSSDGFWSKWLVLEFPYKFVTREVYDASTEEDKKKLRVMNPDIIEQISTPQEMSGLLNKALDGLDRLLNQKHFSNSKGTNEVKHFWIRKSDSFASFCMDCLESDYEYTIPKSVLRKLYSHYCKHYNVKGVSDKSIKATLEEEFGVSEARRTMQGEFVNCWDGIKLNIRGIRDIIGISPLYKILYFTIGSNMGDTLDTLDSSLDLNSFLRIKGSYNP